MWYQKRDSLQFCQLCVKVALKSLYWVKPWIPAGSFWSWLALTRKLKWPCPLQSCSCKTWPVHSSGQKLALVAPGSQYCRWLSLLWKCFLNKVQVLWVLYLGVNKISYLHPVPVSPVPMQLLLFSSWSLKFFLFLFWGNLPKTRNQLGFFSPWFLAFQFSLG